VSQGSLPLTLGTGSAVVVDACQVCGERDLRSLLFLGYLPPVNQMHPIGQRPRAQPAYPAEWLRCPRCQLVQLGLIVDAEILFPPDYPYTSGTTRVLRENFAELYRECQSLLGLGADDLIVDVGSNDGTLLANFQAGGHPVVGVEPTQAGELARARGITTYESFFSREAAEEVVAGHGRASVITITNAFAHIENVHAIVEAVLALLRDDGVFITESHYLADLVETLQYDTIYHEHMRYYSLHSLRYLLEMHGLEVFHARRIPTHGGSIRVYAARKGARTVQPSVDAMLAEERVSGVLDERLAAFGARVVASKLELFALLAELKRRPNSRIYGIGAPSRASTLINYVGLDDRIVDCVVEVTGSKKVGKYMPGTLIPVLDEAKLFEDQPEYALLLSWHIADELIANLRRKGFAGEFIVPLPTPRVTSGSA
jgi:hypothetical protein